MSITVDGTPQSVGLRMYRGDDFGFDLPPVLDAALDPADLTGATVLAQIRATPDATVVQAEFDYAITGNVVTLFLSADKVAAVTDRSRWDCELTFGDGSIRTIAFGPVAVVADVSRL